MYPINCQMCVDVNTFSLRIIQTFVKKISPGNSLEQPDILESLHQKYDLMLILLICNIYWCSIVFIGNISVQPPVTTVLQMYNSVPVDLHTGLSLPSWLKMTSFNDCNPSRHCRRWSMLSRWLPWRLTCFSLYSRPWRYNKPNWQHWHDGQLLVFPFKCTKI